MRNWSKSETGQRNDKEKINLLISSLFRHIIRVSSSRCHFIRSVFMKFTSLKEKADSISQTVDRYIERNAKLCL